MSRRRALGTLIVALWLGMVGWHVRREYFRPELARLAEAALALNPGVSFYTLRMGERAVGQATSRLDTLPDGFELEDLVSLELPALGETGAAVARTYVRLSPALEMRRFEFSLDSEVGRFQAQGEVGADSTLKVTIDSQGSTETLEFRLGAPPVFSAVVPIRLALGEGLEVGKRVRMPVFDPSTFSTREVEVRVLEHGSMVVADSARLDPSGRWQPARWDTLSVWRVAEVFGGVSLESWIDEDGRVVRATSPLGFSMERTEYELASQAARDDRGREARVLDEDVILATAIRGDVDLADLQARDELRFRLTGVDLAGFDLEGGRQTLRGDTLVVRREDWDALEAGYELPYKRMDLRADSSPSPSCRVTIHAS